MSSPPPPPLPSKKRKKSSRDFERNKEAARDYRLRQRQELLSLREVNKMLITTLLPQVNEILCILRTTSSPTTPEVKTEPLIFPYWDDDPHKEL